jgi:two-component system sensor histidine kinase UhpB
VESAPLPAGPLWGRAEVQLDGRREASVWVAVDPRPPLIHAAELGAGFALLGALLAAVLYLLPVRAIARAERRVSGLLGRLTLAMQEEDRARIARDLHDGAGQAITAARMELSALRTAGAEPAAVARIAGLLDEALDEVRRSTAALTPPALAELGLERALLRHCEAFGDAVGLSVSCTVDGELPPLHTDLETACYRIVQEALTNTARHARATRAWVRLRTDGDRLLLEVGDDGAGLPAERSGSGIEGIRERARLLGGEVDVSSGEGGGTKLGVALPIR